MVWKENDPLKAVRFFYVYLPIVRAECPDSEFEFFSSSNYSKFAIKFD